MNQLLSIATYLCFAYVIASFFVIKFVDERPLPSDRKKKKHETIPDR